MSAVIIGGNTCDAILLANLDSFLNLRSDREAR